MAALIADSVWFSPPARTAEERSGLVAAHQSGQYYLVAKKMISTLLPSPAIGWSQPQACGDVGRGVWLIQGTVNLQPPAGQQDWIVILQPQNPQPLYLRLGKHEVGNAAAALAQAGLRQQKR